MIATAKIVGYDGEYLTVKPLVAIDRELLQKQVDIVSCTNKIWFFQNIKVCKTVIN